MAHAEYTSGDDIVLTWTPLVRGYGAGLSNPDNTTDAEPIWEGLFEIEVYVSDVLMRTATAIDALEWTYTNAMNVSDNGTPSDEIVFKLKNYRTVDGNVYSSDQVELTVKKE